MAKGKLQRMHEVRTFANVLEPPLDLAGRWRESYFRNDGPITLELACGRGEYSIALAQRLPRQNFIGIDIKGARLWYGARQALDLQLTNVAFIRTAIENLDILFAEDEIREIWIPFPDPHRTFSRRHHRLTSPRFLQM